MMQMLRERFRGERAAYGKARIATWFVLSAAACWIGAVGCDGETLDSVRAVQQGQTYDANPSSWAYRSLYGDHRLIYVPDREGDRIAEFGRVGHRLGEHGLPSEELPSQGDYTIQGEAPLPTPQADDTDICSHDHTQAIQLAINQVANEPPDASGVKGRVYLDRGHYAIHATLDLKAGVVLRGVSQWSNASGDPPTTLHACRTSGGSPLSTLINIDGGSGPEPVGDPVAVEDEVVPSGGNMLHVTSGHGFQVGDVVRVVRPSPQAWLDAIHMVDSYMPKAAANLPTSNVWEAGDYDLTWERTILHIEPGEEQNVDRLLLDQPLTNALERKYGQSYILALEVPEEGTPRSSNAAVYKLRGTATINEFICNPDVEKCPKGEVDWSDRMIQIGGAEDIWIRDVIASKFSLNAVKVKKSARRVTIEDVKYINPIGPISGGWRYPFQVNGELNLVVDCESFEGRHDFVPGARSTGPNVFADSQAIDSYNDSGPHHRWATGALFDHVSLSAHSSEADGSAGQLNVRNRNNSNGHGWTGSSMVTWNSTAEAFRYYNPPTGQNWLIGSTGQFEQPSTGEDNFESLPHFDFEDEANHDVGPVQPGGLYHTARALAFEEGSLIEERHYFVGDADNFGTDGDDEADTDDAVYANQHFVDWFSTYTAVPPGTTGFDATDDFKSVPFSIRYVLRPDEEIVHAYLAVHMDRVGAYTGDDWHVVQLAGIGDDADDFIGRAVTYHWECDDIVGPCTALRDHNITAPIGWPLSGEPSVRVIDLGPHLGELNETLQIGGQHLGELNVNMSRRTKVDWASLSLVTKRPSP